MVLPVGGFFPIPLAMMIPFMATQSLVMGEAFGKAFQFGKRKMSAMSNEDFNALKIEDVASDMFKSYKNIIPELKESIAQSADFQNHIFAQLILLGPNLIAALSGAVLQPKDLPEGGTGTVIQDPTGQTAADVFATTVDSFDVNRKDIPLDSSVPTFDWYKHNVYRDMWMIIPFGISPTGTKPDEGINLARTFFIKSFTGSMASQLEIQRITVIKSGGQTDVGTTNLYHIIYYLD